jgi:hypothetical protein
MTNEEFVRHAYALAEVKDIAGMEGRLQHETAFSDILGQLGVLGNLGAVLQEPASV